MDDNKRNINSPYQDQSIQSSSDANIQDPNLITKNKKINIPEPPSLEEFEELKRQGKVIF